MGKAIIYARVSTEEQVRSGFSLAQQLEALRGYAEREGHDVLEEVSDPGQSGASLDRPGMDRVRDLVAEGGVSVVLAQDRDRFAREPAYLYLLREEFAEHGCRLRALNDRGDESPEGELTDGILDQLAKYERAKTAERSRRGRLRKAREGKIVASERPHLGFRYDENREAYEVEPETMALVREMFRIVAEGGTLHSVKRAFKARGVPSPGGGSLWNTTYIRHTIEDDAYMPHTAEELDLLVAEGLLAEDVARRTPEGVGVRWHNRQSIKKRNVRERGRYRRVSKKTEKPRHEWIAVPTAPAGIPREWVEAARRAVKKNRRAPKKNLRFWELSGGVLRCAECGRAMSTFSTHGGRGGKLFHYYRCSGRAADGPEACPNPKSVPAEKTEALVWRRIHELLSDPAKLSAGISEAAERPRSPGSPFGPPAVDRASAARRLAACEKKRLRYQEMAAEDLISFEELRGRLHDLDSESARLLESLSKAEERAERAEKKRRQIETIVAELSAIVPERLANLAPEKRHRVYRTLEFEITSDREGRLAATGLLSPLEFLRDEGVYTDAR